MSETPKILAVRLGDGGRRAAAFVDATRAVDPAEPGPADQPLTHVLAGLLREARERRFAVRGFAFALPTGERWTETVSAAAERLGTPCVAQTVAVAALEGERIAGPAARDGSAVLFDADEVQVAMQLDGEAYRGARGRAGEVTHLGLDRTGGLRCSCGRSGCLGALLQAGPHAPVPPLPASCAPIPSRSLGWLAVAGIALVNTLNPALLIVRGSAFEESSASAWFKRVVRGGCLAETGSGLRDIVRARPDGLLTGAAALFAARHPWDPPTQE